MHKRRKIKKKGSFYTSSNFIVLYLDNDFNDDYIYFEVTVYKGSFIYTELYYSFVNQRFNDIEKNQYVFLDSNENSYKTRDINYHNKIYDEFTYYYKIPHKKGYKYVYIYYPKFEGGLSSYLIVKNVIPSSAGVIVGIVMGIVVFLVILIIIIFWFLRKRRKNLIDYSTSGYSSKMADYNYPNQTPMPLSNNPSPDFSQPEYPPYKSDYISAEPSYNSTQSNNIAPSQ